MKKNILSTIIIVLVLLIAGSLLIAQNKQSEFADDTNSKPNQEGEATFCTMDAMMCPDGSYVGRTGPNCEFVCPAAESSVDPNSAEMKIGESRTVNGVNIKVNKIMEESRCPIDAVCIQAGKFVANVTLSAGATTKTLDITEGGAATTLGSAKITLVRAQPMPMASPPTLPGNYRLFFKVEK